MIKHLRNGISVRSNSKRFAEFTNCNLSQRLFELTLLFSMMLKNISFPLTVPRPTSIWGKDFSLQSPEFYSCIQFEIRKKIGLLILLNCEPASLTVFATMCPKAWFPYDFWRLFTIAGIASKLFSDRNDHMETKFSFCQRSPTIATITIAGIESESISAIVNDRQRSQKVNGNHQCSDCSDGNDCNDPSDHMEIIAQRS